MKIVVVVARHAEDAEDDAVDMDEAICPRYAVECATPRDAGLQENMPPAVLLLIATGDQTMLEDRSNKIQPGAMQQCLRVSFRVQ